MEIVEQEEWRAIPGQPGYEAGAGGKIRSLDRIVISESNKNGRAIKGRVLKRSFRCGYPSVTISGKSFHVHRLVALAFFGEIPEGMEVNHKDGVKRNNNVSNLEIITASENILHAFAIGLKTPQKGELHGQAKLTDEMVREIRAIKGCSQRAIAAKFGVTQSIVWAILAGKIWRHVS